MGVHVEDSLCQLVQHQKILWQIQELCTSIKLALNDIMEAPACSFVFGKCTCRHPPLRGYLHDACSLLVSVRAVCSMCMTVCDVACCPSCKAVCLEHPSMIVAATAAA